MKEIKEFFTWRWQVNRTHVKPAITSKLGVAENPSLRLHSDQAITGLSDSQDRLNRTKYAKVIADSVRKVPADSSLTFSIEGPWGHGKSSVLHLIQKSWNELEEADQPIVCPFNPWMVDEAEDLVHLLITQLASVIGMSDSAGEGKKVAKALLSYSSLFTALKFVPGAEPWASMAENVISGVGEASEKISDLKGLSIEERKNGVVQAIKGLRRPIAVFIDDMDRLPPQELFQMVRAIKAACNFPRVAYVLCFDAEYAVAALNSCGVPKAVDYLDKIVQVRLTLPRIDRDDLQSLLNERLKLFHSQYADRIRSSPDENRIGMLYSIGIRELIENVRDINRLMNRLAFSVQGCEREVNFADLLALELIALKSPEVYSHIRNYPVAYVGYRDDDHLVQMLDGDAVKSYQRERDKVLNLVDARLRRPILRLIKELFPLTNSTGVHGLSDAKNRAAGFIAARDRLEIALAFGMSRSEVSLETAASFIREASNRRNISSEVLTGGKLDRFLEHIDALSENENIPNVQGFILELGSMLETDIARRSDSLQTSMLWAPIGTRVWRIVEVALTRLEESLRAQLAIWMITTQSGVPIGLATYAIRDLHNQHGHFDQDDAVPESRRWLSTLKLSEAREIWKRRMEDAVRDGSIFDSLQSGLAISLFVRLFPREASSLVAPLLTTDEGFDTLVLAIAHTGWDSSGGEYALRDKKFLKALGGESDIEKMAEKRLKAIIPDNRLRHALRAFSSGKKVYLATGIETDEKE